MPSFGVATKESHTDRDASIPYVEYENGGAMRYARVISITQSTGITPGTAEIAVSNVYTVDEATPVTLARVDSLSEKSLPYYSRIRIKQGAITLFIGNLTDRVESSRSGITTLNYSDYRVQMSKIPIIGCWVKDPYTEKVTWVDRYLPIFNPGGYKNCVYGKVGKDTWPVFTYQAEAGSAGRSSDEAGTGADGAPCFWTSQRALEYIRLCATVPPPGDNDYLTSTVKIMNPDECSWPEGTTSFKSELMRERLPETPIVGMSILGAIHKILDISSEYGMTLRYEGYNVVEFYPRDSVKDNNQGVSFDLLTSGVASGFTGICEYQILADATNVYTGCRVHGSPYQVESSFHYDPGVGDFGYGIDGTLIPGWTTTEGEAYREMIIGDGNNYARAPQDPARPLDSWVSMDGNDGRPLIRPKTTAALQMARACFPKAYRAFRLPSDSSGGGYSAVTTVLDGSGDTYKKVPRLNIPRMPGPEQLQPYYESAGDLRGRIRYPVRIRVAEYGSATNELHDVTANSGFRVTDDGLIWLDGLTDESNTYDRIYEGSFFIDPAVVKLKHFFINMWIPGDTRVCDAEDLFAGAKDVRSTKARLSKLLFDGKRKGMEFYVLDPDGYLDEHQVNSEPSPAGSVIGARGDLEPQPLTGSLRTDYGQITKHCVRRLKHLTAIRRGGDIRFPTIRADLKSGYMVKHIKKHPEGSDDWICFRPIKTLKFNYQEQQTSVELE